MYAFRSRGLISAALILASSSHMVLAGSLDGQSATIGSGAPVESWTLINGSTLNVTAGGATNAIHSMGSTVNVASGTVSSVSDGVELRNGSTSTITGAAISVTGGRGLSLANTGSSPGSGLSSSATVTDSIISGVGFGAGVSSAGTLSLSRTTLIGTDDGGSAPWSGGVGLGLFGATVLASNGSVITGDKFGVATTLDNRGGANRDTSQRLVVDGSSVEGKAGSAIFIYRLLASAPNDVDIVIQNGSTLTGGNGNILEVTSGSAGGSKVSFTVDNSALNGNVVVDDASTADITLHNNASLTGQLTNVENLALNSDGTWKMISDGGVANLAMDGGAVEISDGSGTDFHTLTVGTLSGNGAFVMGTNLGVPAGDKLVVTEAHSARGNYMLHVRNTGAEPTVENVLTVVETNGGDATFGVVGGAVDLGVYKYFLHKNGNNWQLAGSKDTTVPPCTPGVDCPVDPDPEREALSESAKTVISLHAAAANIWYGETGTLRQRMGDVRAGRGENGLWGRTYGRKLNGNGAAGVDFDQDIGGAQAGAEREASLGGVPIILGAFGGYSNSTVKIGGGSEGEIDSGYGGIYAIWLGNDGLYVDGLFKVNRFCHDARVIMSDGAGASGDYSTNAIGGQIEIGKTYAHGNGFYAEPFVQLAALRIGSFVYGLNNGMNTHGDAYGSVQGRIGAIIGYNHKLKDGGVFQPYVRLAVAQEFVDMNELKINAVGFNNAFNGTRGEGGIGFAYQLNEAVQIHADVDFSRGKDVNRNWGGNFSLSCKF